MRLIVLLLGSLLASTLTGRAAVETVETTLVSSRHTNATPLIEGPNDPSIVKFVTQILRRQHYLRLAINDEASSKFFDRYLDSLDAMHLYFLQSDVQEFETYRYKLDDLTQEAGDTTPARVIFNRYRQRLSQQHEYVHELLKN